MPTLGFHVPEDSELAKRVLKRVSDTHYPSTSAYVRKLVEADLEGGAPPNAMSPRILVELTKELCGGPEAAEIAAMVGDRNQPKELGAILSAYISAAKGEEPPVPMIENWKLWLKEARDLARETTLHPKPQNPPELRGK